MAKRKSGGARAVEKKNRERESARARAAADANPQADWMKKVKRLGAPPASPESAHEWLGRAAILIVHATMTDVGLPPEQMRRDAMKQIEQAQKAIGSAKLAAELRELYEALKDGKDAAPQPGGDDPLCEETPPLS